MGLGPNNTTILPRISVDPLSDKTAEDLETWVREKQIERGSARAMGALKRREAKAPKVKVPKPRRHKHHCPCLAEAQCCRCRGDKCLKPKKLKKTKTTIGTLTSPVTSIAVSSVEKA